MNIHFTGRHTNITPEISRYCERRVRSLEKALGQKIVADIILSVEKYRHKAEIKLKADKKNLNAVEETHDTFASLGLAFDSIEKRAKKEREKLRERKRRINRRKGVFSLPSEREERRGRVIRSQDFSPKPLTLEEALFQFDLENRDVFVFQKPGSEKWSVLYRRKDGNYGLVEPE